MNKMIFAAELVVLLQDITLMSNTNRYRSLGIVNCKIVELNEPKLENERFFEDCMAVLEIKNEDPYSKSFKKVVFGEIKNPTTEKIKIFMDGMLTQKELTKGDNGNK